MGIAVGTGAAVITDIGIAISLATSMNVRAGATVTDIGIAVTLAARRTVGIVVGTRATIVAHIGIAISLAACRAVGVASRTGSTVISLATGMAV